ncbi:MAG: hypothetical protein ACFB10_00680 [Salibacteraceae bacterium]
MSNTTDTPIQIVTKPENILTANNPTTKIGDITIQNPALPKSYAADLSVPKPTIVNSSDGKYAAVFEWKLIGAIAAEACGSSYQVTSYKGSTIETQHTAVTNYVQDGNYSLGFEHLAGSINNSFGWSESNQQSLMVADTKSIAYTMNPSANTVNLMWQLHVTYQCLEVGTQVIHRVDEFHLSVSVPVPDFDTFIFVMGPKPIGSPNRPTISDSGSTVYANSPNFSVLNDTCVAAPTWADRCNSEANALINDCLSSDGCTLVKATPNRYSTRSKSGRCPDPANRPPAVANDLVAGEGTTIMFPVPFATPDDPTAIAGAIAGIFTDDGNVEDVKAEFNYEKDSHVCLRFATTGSGTQAAVTNAFVEDRWVIYNGGYGTVGGTAAAKQRFGSAVGKQYAATGNFAWVSEYEGSEYIGKPQSNPDKPDWSVAFGKNTKKTVGNTTTSEQISKTSEKLGIKFPVGLGKASLCNISASLTETFTTKDSNTFGLALNEETDIERTYSFKAKNSDPVWMVTQVFQLCVSFNIGDDATTAAGEKLDIFFVRSQFTEASS